MDLADTIRQLGETRNAYLDSILDARMGGVKIIPSPMVPDGQVYMMVSEKTWRELQERIERKE